MPNFLTGGALKDTRTTACPTAGKPSSRTPIPRSGTSTTTPMATVIPTSRNIHILPGSTSATPGASAPAWARCPTTADGGYRIGEPHAAARQPSAPANDFASHSFHHGRDPVVHAQLGVEAADVRVDRGCRYAQNAGMSRSICRGDPVQHLVFPGPEIETGSCVDRRFDKPWHARPARMWAAFTTSGSCAPPSGRTARK